MSPQPSVNWTMESVLARLREQARGSGTVAANVFLSGPESGTEMKEVVRQAVNEAAAAAGPGTRRPEIGRVSDMAKSFSLTAEPAVFAALARNPRVKSILPSVIPDIYPKPTKDIRDPPKNTK
jgi:hypothetical protein